MGPKSDDPSAHEELGIELADALPEDEEESTSAIRITEVQPVNPELLTRDRATLTVLSGPDTGRVFPVKGTPVFGRGRECEVRVDDTSVSRAHARIVTKGGLHWFLEDLKSRNGTFVNGTRVVRHELSDGDHIQLGASLRFRFSITNGEEEGVLRKLYEASVRDGLTGAFNRKHFNERLAVEVSYSIRHGTELSLVMFDIDHFKRVNDEYGHLAGDRVLTALTGVMQHTVRAEDILARYGGEEFAIIARGTNLAGAMSLGERVRGMAERLSIPFEGRALRVTVSVGVAVFSELQGKRDSAGLIARADSCLYLAKETGRNRVVGPHGK